jgi:hypothetical protein
MLENCLAESAEAKYVPTPCPEISTQSKNDMKKNIHTSIVQISPLKLETTHLNN